MTVVLLGPPGAGKGTQAPLLARLQGLVHVSTGDMLRQEIASGTALGREVEAVIAAGRLVPDETVAAMVGARLDAAPGGLLLDGFPRTVRQAELLDELLERRGLPKPVVVELVVPPEDVVRRLQARRTCPRCGPRPPGEAACVACGSALSARSDDAEAVVRERLRVYAEKTAPLSEHYSRAGLLRVVDGVGDAHEVARRIADLFSGGGGRAKAV